MRIILSLIAILVLTSTESDQAIDGSTMLADAEQATITSPYTVSIEDNYGNPDAFVKYIIRKPPAIA